MISREERLEIIERGLQDGERLFVVMDWVWKGFQVLAVLHVVVGLLLAVLMVSHSAFIAAALCLFSGVVTGALCYGSGIVATHGAKILIHLLFSNLAILERMEGGES